MDSDAAVEAAAEAVRGLRLSSPDLGVKAIVQRLRAEHPTIDSRLVRAVISEADDVGLDDKSESVESPPEGVESPPQQIDKLSFVLNCAMRPDLVVDWLERIEQEHGADGVEFMVNVEVDMGVSFAESSATGVHMLTPLFATTLDAWPEARRAETMRMLLERKADPNHQHPMVVPNGFCTALAQASNRGMIEHTRLLLEAKAQVRTEGAPGGTKAFTPLYMAAGNGHVEVVRMLLQAAPQMLDVPNGNDVTPLMNAAIQGDTSSRHVECVQLLIEARANPNARAKDPYRRDGFGAPGRLPRTAIGSARACHGALTNGWFPEILGGSHTSSSY